MSEVRTEQKSPVRLWLLGAAIALALHLGGVALTLAHLQTTVAADDSDGNSGIEVGFEMAGEQREETNLPPAPDSSAAAPSPSLPDQKAEVKETELPQDKPMEVEEADQQVSPNESKKPKEEEPTVATVETKSSPASVAAEDSEARLVKARRERGEWQQRLFRHLEKSKKYPEGPRKTLEVSVRFTLDRLGHVLSTEIDKGSGFAAYDEAALAMVKHSDPVPPPPPLTADEGLTFTLPVIFRVKGKS